MYNKKISKKELSNIIDEITEGLKNSKTLKNYLKIFENEIKKKENFVFVDLKDIDTLKNFAIKLRQEADKESWDIGRTTSDFIFSIETDYQSYYGLDENDWDLYDKGQTHEFSLG